MLQNQANAREQYFNSSVLTATPQKLHLMLIEGAIRFSLLTKHLWDQEDKQIERHDAMLRIIDIVGELLAGIRLSKEPLAKEIEPVYTFILRNVSESCFDTNLEKLDDAVRILEIERETWSQLCVKMEGTTPDTFIKQESAPKPTAIPISEPSSSPEGGFSFEA